MINYKLLPERTRRNVGKLANKHNNVISVVTPFYNGGATLEQTAISLFNQTFPFFEWIIVDDGSKDKDSLKKLEEIAKTDRRIKIFHKKNEGPSLARDFGIKNSSNDSKYIFFLDCDDIIENTMLECLHWTLEMHPDASFAYTAMTNFGDNEFVWNRYLSSKTEKKENVIPIASMVKKEDLLEVGCFGIEEKAMYEDWNLWLKLLAAGKKPIRIYEPLFWYRISNSGELSRAKKNHKNAMKYVNETAKNVSNNCEIYQYPCDGDKYITPDNFDVTDWNKLNLPMYKKEDGIKTLLFIFPWLMVGGADLFNLELIKRLDRSKFRILVLTALPNDNPLRQEFFENVDEYYDMASFMDRKDYIKFVDYLISSRNVDVVMNSNSTYGYAMLPYIRSKYPEVAIFDYIHSIDLKDVRGGFGRYTKDFEEAIDSTYVCNDFTKNQLKTMFKKDNVETIYIGTDTNRFDPAKFDKDELRKKYNLPDDHIVVTFLARISEEKRPELFIKIARNILAERKKFTFLIAGDGPLYKNIEKLIKKYGISNNVHMLGMIKETEEIYSISDITVNCSRLEGLALTSYESLAMNVPVVSADVGGQKELINSDVGHIISYKEVMNKEEKKQELDEYVNAILDITDNLDKYRKNARKRVLEGFSYDIMSKNMIEIFNTIKPKKDKIPLNIGLSAYKSTIEFLFDEYDWLVHGYNGSHYAEINKKGGFDYYHFKETMWKYPAYRALVKSPVWKLAKKVLRR